MNLAGMPVSPPVRRFVAAAMSVAILAISLPVTIGIAMQIDVAADFVLYRDAAARWVAGGSFYNPEQLSGPYVIEHGAVLYPPVALILLVPFTVLPSVLWWAVPVGVVAWGLSRLRPRPMGWPIMAILVGFSPLPVLIVAGNPGIWVIAFLMAGVVVAGPAALVLVKPSLAPFALFGSWHRAWWFWAGGLLLACLPFGTMWLDWVAAVTNASAPWFYSFRETGLMLVPIVAWLARSRAGRGGAQTSGSAEITIAAATEPRDEQARSGAAP